MYLHGLNITVSIPEVGSMYGDVLMTGLDYGRYPSASCLYIRIKKHIIPQKTKVLWKQKNIIIKFALIGTGMMVASCADDFWIKK